MVDEIGGQNGTKVPFLAKSWNPQNRIPPHDLDTLDTDEQIVIDVGLKPAAEYRIGGLVFGLQNGGIGVKESVSEYFGATRHPLNILFVS